MAADNLIRWEGADIMRQNVDILLDQFTADNNIQDFKTEAQNIWTAFLMYCRDSYFKLGGYRILFDRQHGRYDMERVNDVLDYYLYLCMKYDKEVSVAGFSYLTGIERDMIDEWGKDTATYPNGKNKLNAAGFGVYQKLSKANEDSLSGMLVSGKRNPVAILGALNHKHSWNAPFIKNDSQNRTLTARELPKLGEVKRVEVVEVVENNINS